MLMKLKIIAEILFAVSVAALAIIYSMAIVSLRNEVREVKESCYCVEKAP